MIQRLETTTISFSTNSLDCNSEVHGVSHTTMARVNLVILLILGVSLVPSSCRQTHGVGGTAADSSTVMGCKGGNLTLYQPDKGVTVLHTSVFRGEESLVNSFKAASGQFQDRLTVEREGRVTLSNLTLDDFGKYRVEVQVSKNSQTQRTLRLVISEPPETTDGRLLVTNIPTSGNNSVRLTCGNFKSLGFPPLSVVWKDPRGDIIPSDGFEDHVFYLDVSVSSAMSGDYCCQLDCRAPDYCCLDQRSSLRQCAPVHVQTHTVQEVRRVDCPSLDTSSHLQQQVLDLATMTQLLEKFRDQVASDVSNAVERLETNANSSREALQRRMEDLGHKMDSGFCKLGNDSSKVSNDYSSTVLIHTTQSPVNNKQGKCFEGYSLYGGRCLKANTSLVDYQTANASCLTDGAHLVNIKSRDVDALVLRNLLTAAGLILPSTTYMKGVWVGANNLLTNKSFVWSDGSPLPMTSELWNLGEPNNVNNNEHCVEVYIFQETLSLNDNDCTKSYHYICEHDP